MRIAPNNNTNNNEEKKEKEKKKVKQFSTFKQQFAKLN